jgi:ribosomal protein S18 acetylase RimI-like enzyme
MKRLYVTLSGRGTGVGKILMNAALESARQIRYTHIVLDTLSTMHTAQKLYLANGFAVIDAYYDTPVENTISMFKKLE